MRKVIYSAIVGKYDTISQPKIIDKSFDYLLFTNDIAESNIGVWQIRKIPYKNSNKTRVARWVKTHPHTLLPDYDISLWHDANVIIDRQEYYDRINTLIKDGVFLASMDHLLRHCVYEEAFAIMRYNLDSAKKIMKEILHIKHDGYPANNGLIETNCMLRRHHNQQVCQFCNEWWRMIDNYSLRDQISCNYIAWKLGLTIHYILPPGRNSRNHCFLHCKNHVPQYKPTKIIWIYSLGNRFSKRAKHSFDNFVFSRPYSIQEYFSVMTILFIHKYYAMVAIKYMISTWLKKSLKF